MGKNSKIEWCRHTFNAWAGCSHASPGCDNCYAEVMAKRAPHLVYGRHGVKNLPVWGDDAPRRMTRPDNWQNPRRWNEQTKKTPDECIKCGGRVNVRSEQGVVLCGEKIDDLGNVCGGTISRGVRESVFVNSMSDTFDDWQGQVVDAGCLETLDEVREHLWALIEECTALDFLLLTKRPGNILRMVPARWLKNAHCPSCLYDGCIADAEGNHSRCGAKLHMWPRNVWVGITAENQEQLELRVPHLMQVPAPVRFISYEPAIGPLDFRFDLDATTNRFGLVSCPKCHGWGEACRLCRGSGVGVDWLIAGGESGTGPRIRSCDVSWLDQARKQCETVGIEFFCKQLGAKPHASGHAVPISDKKGGNIDDFPEVLRVRNVPIVEGMAARWS